MRFSTNAVAAAAAALVAAVVLSPSSADAFVLPQQQQSSLTKLSMSSPTLSNSGGPGQSKPTEIPYGEESRKYRRTVYSHDDWVKHRSSDRFWKNLKSTTSSGIYKNVGREVIAVTSVSVLCMLWNMLTAGYTDLGGVAHGPVLQSQYLPPLVLPMNPFTLSSSFLGLLLVFRTNKAYQRWDEARKNWGMNINHTRDLVRMGNAFYDESNSSPQQRQADLARLSQCTWAFVRSMKRHLSPEWEDEADFQRELFERLPAEQAQSIIDAAHRPNRALYDLSMAVENLPMHFIRKDEMHKALTIFEDNLGSSERLLTSPVPIFYNRHVARFLFVWHLFLPFALYGECKDSWNHFLMVPSTAILSLFMFGIEELATQMEEPFTILPMQAFCDKIGNWCNEIVSWQDGDNGITTKKTIQGHNSVYFEPSLDPSAISGRRT
mmetsp:Transcript_59581/g.146004  ORF Transcript_59581/g.146004 Transcript_59581/m.146004 type:complete len:435 (+) Transcript_59581:258-1562(+)